MGDLRCFFGACWPGCSQPGNVYSFVQGKGIHNVFYVEWKMKTEFHLIIECQITPRIAFGSEWGCNLQALNLFSLVETITFCVNPSKEACFRGLERDFLTCFLANLFYCTWLFRNDKLHRGTEDIE